MLKFKDSTILFSIAVLIYDMYLIAFTCYMVINYGALWLLLFIFFANVSVES